MKATVYITEEVEKFIQNHGAEYFPNECCGFLYGKEGDKREITLAKRVDNSKEGDQRRRFEISPKDYMDAERFAILNDLDLLGIYHSHPNHPAIASEHDLAKAMPFFSYLIISVNEGIPGDLKSWKLENDERKFTEEHVEVKYLIEK
ncbi:MAG: M67 family metallopeptidase [Saprospiraceae bacterium]